MKAAKPHKRQKIYFTIRKAILIDHTTGEVLSNEPRLVLVAMGNMDRAEMKRRKFYVGQDVRGDITKPRNYKFHCLAHALGGLVAKQVEGFPSNWHEALKRLQRESGIMCEVLDVEIPNVGLLQVNQARSISFDEMDEAEFHEFYRGICRHIAAKYWPHMTEEAIAEQAELMENET